MTKKWQRFRNPWDREYARRGVLWRGVEETHWLTAWVPPGARIVELGCGDGKFLAGLRRAGFDAVGLDFSPHAVRLAQRRASGPTLLGDLRRLPIASARVRAASARYALGSLRAPGREASAAELGRVLAPGGVLLLEEFGREDFRYGTGQAVEPHTFERNQGLLTHYFDLEEFGRLFPAWPVLHSEAPEGRQRVGDGVRPRRKLRLVLERP